MNIFHNEKQFKARQKVRKSFCPYATLLRWENAVIFTMKRKEQRGYLLPYHENHVLPSQQ